MSSVIDVLAATTDESGFAFGPGLIGFLVLVGLALAVLLLYLNMRKQLKRIDFNPDGLSDAERMRGHDATGDGAGEPGDVRRPDIAGPAGQPDDVRRHGFADPADDGNGHR